MIDVDHHHDNSRFGDVNLVDGNASSTAEILVRIFDGLGVEITPEIAEALYVGLVTDTGRFQYRTTSPDGAAAGARGWSRPAPTCTRSSSGCSRACSSASSLLLGRVIEHAVPYCDGRLLVSHVSRDDLALVEGDEATTEGLIDHLRAVEGVQVAGLIREQVPLRRRHASPRTGSRCARAALIDVSRSRASPPAAATSRRPGSRIRAPSTTSASSSWPRSAAQLAEPAA